MRTCSITPPSTCCCTAETSMRCRSNSFRSLLRSH
jgi:hypothetical protein